MSKISNAGTRAAVNPKTITDGALWDKTVNIEPIVPELVSEIKESAKAKLLGAVILFPKTQDREAKRYWISFDHLYAAYQDNKELYSKWYDNEKKVFVGMCKLGVHEGNAFLVAA